MALFLERGFDATPMGAIADAAGVSRRTLYRYFATKDDIVFESPREWLELFNSVVADRRDDEPVRDVFLRALVVISGHIQEQRERVVREFTVLTSSPSLRARHGRSDAEWVDRYLELLLPATRRERDGVLQATVCAMALVATQNALISVWATGPRSLDLADLAAKAFTQIDGVWPASTR